MRNTENLTREEKRELYKAMRSAHDGICPQCGGTTVTSLSETYTCIDGCEFYLTEDEAELIRSFHSIFHHDLKRVMSQFRL